MIYVCIPAFNEARTVGLVLWKVRRVFEASTHEYHLLVTDDGSDDDTSDVLASYARVLPLTLVEHPMRAGYASTLEELLRRAVKMTDRPKRDWAITMHADFTHDPSVLPDFVKRMESGSDVVVGEDTGGVSPGSMVERFLHWTAPRLLRPVVRLPDVRDVLSGFYAIRLSTLKRALRDVGRGQLMAMEGWSANAELLSRTCAHARRVEAIPAPLRYDLRQRPMRKHTLSELRSLWRAREAISQVAT